MEIMKFKVLFFQRWKAPVQHLICILPLYTITAFEKNVTVILQSARNGCLGYVKSNENYIAYSCHCISLVGRAWIAPKDIYISSLPYRNN